MDKARSVAHNAGESARTFGRNAFQASNLLPAALIGVGFFWLRRNWGETGNGYESEMYGEQKPGEYRYIGAESSSGYEPGSAYGGYESADARAAAQGYYGDVGYRREGERGFGEGQGDTAEQLREGATKLRERAGDIASQAGERVRQTTRDVRERAGEYVERTGSQLREFQSTARQRTRELWDQGSRLLDEYPLEVTGAMFAVGVLAGLLMPSTRREDELLGEARDDVVERAKETGRETVQKLQNVGQQTMESAKDAMQREGLADRGTVEKAQDAAGRVADQARSKVGQATEPSKTGAEKSAEPVRPSAQAWDPGRSSAQDKPVGNAPGKDKSAKEIKVEHDIKIKKE